MKDPQPGPQGTIARHYRVLSRKRECTGHIYFGLGHKEREIRNTCLDLQGEKRTTERTFVKTIQANTGARRPHEHVVQMFSSYRGPIGCLPHLPTQARQEIGVVAQRPHSF